MHGCSAYICLNMQFRKGIESAAMAETRNNYKFHLYALIST